MSKRRVRLPYRKVKIWKPVWDETIRNWASKYIKENKWRVEPIHEFRDLMQEAYIIFLRVADKYPRVVEPKQFMALYKMSLANWICDMAREYRRKHNLICEKAEINTSYSEPVETENVAFNALIANGPPELKLLLQMFNDEDKLTEFRKPQRSRRTEPRVNFNRRVSEILGIKKTRFKEVIENFLEA